METRQIIVIDTEGGIVGEYPSIKKAAQVLYGGTRVGESIIHSLCSGRTQKSFCDKINKYIKAKYKN